MPLKAHLIFALLCSATAAAWIDPPPTHQPTSRARSRSCLSTGSLLGLFSLGRSGASHFVKPQKKESLTALQSARARADSSDSDGKVEVSRSLQCGPRIVAGSMPAMASASRAVSDTPLKLIWKGRGLSEFFSENEDDVILTAARKIVVQQACLQPLRSESKEDDVVNALFVELQRQNLRFPRSVISEGMKGIVEEHKKPRLRTLCLELGENLNEQAPMRKEEPGLLVTTESGPDMCVVRSLEGERHEMVLGELKQNEKYTAEWAMDQGLSYMHGLLYYYRVKLGIPVETVYGFTVLGYKCTGIESKKYKEYAVELLKLTAPQQLGDAFRAARYSSRHESNDATGIQLLVHFLKNGNAADVATALAYKREAKQRAPCLFAAPRILWNDLDDGSRKIVLGGTSAIVFRVALHRLDELLETVWSAQAEEWSEYLRQVKKWKDSHSARASPNDTFFYVKVRTRDTNTNFDHRMFAQVFGKLKKHGSEDDDFSAALDDFFNTYIIEPYGEAQFCLTIMADRGNRFDAGSVDCATMKMLLLRLRRQLIAMAAKKLVHGDVLPHNLVYNKANRSLHLIDYDEGSDSAAPLRNCLKSETPWFEALMYPNKLRSVRKLYTTVQFSAMVYKLLTKNGCCEGEKLVEVRRTGENLGRWLLQGTLLGYVETEEDVPREAKSLIGELDHAINEILIEDS